MAKKSLEGADKVQADKASEIFAGVVWPGDSSAIDEKMQTDLKERAKKFLAWRDKQEAMKLPSARSIHFPHYAGFAACMVVSAEESFKLWTRRFLAGKPVRTSAEERAAKLAKAQKLMAQLKALQAEFGGGEMDFSKFLPKDEAPEEEPEDKPAAHEGVADEAEEVAPVVAAPTPEPAKVATEVVPVAPSPVHVWINGYWGWSSGSYAWRPGHWAVPPRPGYVWHPRQWQPGPRGWQPHGGRWGPRR